jgi:hypothetical protein
MNYLISHKQLYKLMTVYLNDFKDSAHESRFENFLYVAQPSGEDWNLTLSYDFSDGELAIEEAWLEDFISWFPISMDDSAEFVKDWFEENYNLPVNSVVHHYVI